jgi:hypothetical protein
MGNGQWAMGNGQWAMGNGQFCCGQYAVGTTGRIWHCSASRNLSCPWVRQELPEWRANREQSGLPKVAGEVVFDLCNQLLFLHSKTLGYSRQMNQIAKLEKRVALFRTLPGVGSITASAIVATVGRHPGTQARQVGSRCHGQQDCTNNLGRAYPQ